MVRMGDRFWYSDVGIIIISIPLPAPQGPAISYAKTTAPSPRKLASEVAILDPYRKMVLNSFISMAKIHDSGCHFKTSLKWQSSNV